MINKISKPLKAIILAAGKGERLKPLTDSVPKCMVPVNGKPLLQYWIDELHRVGVTDILINTHWLNNIVEDYVAQINDSAKSKIKIYFEPKLLGSAGTIAANSSWAQESSGLLIIYADNFSRIDLNELIQSHFSSGSDLTLGVFLSSEPERCGIISVDEKGRGISFVEKPPQPESNLAAAGIYLMAPQKIAKLKELWKIEEGTYDLGYHFFPTEVMGANIFLIECPIIDIGTPDAYHNLCLNFLK